MRLYWLALFTLTQAEISLPHVLLSGGDSWDDLAYEVIAGGGLSNNSGSGGPVELYDLSSKTELGSCDVFVSHSWHDDPAGKWSALSAWCEAFREQHGRPPMLWVDKVCTNQTSIEEDLESLPIFLAACNTLLIGDRSSLAAP